MSETKPKPKSPLPWKHEIDILYDANNCPVIKPLQSNYDEVILDYYDEDMDFIAEACNNHDTLLMALEISSRDLRAALDQWCGLSDELRGREKNWIHNSNDPEAKLYRCAEESLQHSVTLLKRMKGD